ncbi:hypothetical protein EV144_104104 [Flavobacterium sp. 270]|uniref:hypothetical protein n=1 Tax=Flavobacterium sp. 270 TaxID=2512114 RepID=UPI0010E954AF|nr:hypothetical protein [Flavobacterium sp. 270]TDW47818.1 hypothetical protein EV144_104104 [Flavobacterium sp. 270]
MESDNKKLLFEYVTDETGKVYGNVSLFRGSALRTTFTEKNDLVEVSLNGKSVY